ncbi:hypothetical protein [Austwickia chelonae]|uniref:hypothetical protein n=1 Tax=Austwickia chelonae TaxID=100225 RepID=UPI000E23B736|nr:hypothetical protein [Austwickia chelonae]
MPPIAPLRHRRVIGITALLLPLSVFTGQAAAATSTSTTPGSCLPHVESQAVQSSSYWEPHQVKLNGTFPAGCTATPGSQVTLRPRLPAGTQVLSGTYALPGLTMTVAADGTTTFRFNRSGSRAPVNSFSGSIFLDLPRERHAPGSSTLIDWTVDTGKQAGRMRTEVTMPACPSCAGRPLRTTVTAQISSTVEKGNLVRGQVSSATLSQLSLYHSSVLSLDARLGESLACAEASLWDVWGTAPEDRSKISDIACHDGRLSPGGIRVPSDRLRSGHHYVLEISARTTGYRAEGYQIAGTSVFNGHATSSTATAAWLPEQHYGGQDGPEVPVPFLARLTSQPSAPAVDHPVPDLNRPPSSGVPFSPVTGPLVPVAPTQEQQRHTPVLQGPAISTPVGTPPQPLAPPAPIQVPPPAPAQAPAPETLPGMDAQSILTGPPERIASSAPQRVPVRSAAAIAEAAAPLAGRLPTSGTEIIATALYAALLLGGGLGLTAMRQQAGRQGN